MQTHDGRCVAVDIDRLEAVSAKALQSNFDLSMAVWMAMGETVSRAKLSHSRRVSDVARVRQHDEAAGSVGRARARV